jgi:hypothetical protein
MKRLALSCLVLLGLGAPSMADNFHPIQSVSSSTSAGDLWPASNLIQGPGPGFNAAEPHDKNLGGPDGNWVTTDCGFPCDFFTKTGTPVLTFDLGSDVDLAEISTWGYTTTNANGAKEFQLKFATSAEGTGAFGSSISYSPTFGAPLSDVTRSSNLFSQTVKARYVQMTITDNYFTAPGDGSDGGLAGGDRVGLGEVAFEIVPEPSSLSLLLIGILGLRRRRA